MVDLTPQTAVAPGVEVMLNRGVGREILGQQAPLAAALRQIEDRVDHRSQRRRARATATLVRRGQKRLDDGPFGIGCIACIAQPVASILRASDFGPHLVPPSCLATTTESQTAEITQPIFVSASQGYASALRDTCDLIVTHGLRYRLYNGPSRFRPAASANRR